ncbi:hypothetical protein ACGFI9_02235 [Micromonospora sp. NPDC048930]|uniref:hypothetical protein n=1 Tax=Micromonospora sp. NPDC048930 TaxID=3364261 RepID=UPI00370FF9AD
MDRHDRDMEIRGEDFMVCYARATLPRWRGREETDLGAVATDIGNWAASTAVRDLVDCFEAKWLAGDILELLVGLEEISAQGPTGCRRIWRDRWPAARTTCHPVVWTYSASHHLVDQGHNAGILSNITYPPAKEVVQGHGTAPEIGGEVWGSAIACLAAHSTGGIVRDDRRRGTGSGAVLHVRRRADPRAG